MSKKMIHQEYLDKVFNLAGEEYAVLEEYVKSNVKLLTRHNACNREWRINPNKFLMGRRCPYCRYENAGDKTRKPIGTLINQVSNINNGEFELVSGIYENNTSIMEFSHTVCGRTFSMSSANFLMGKKCPLCVKDTRRKNISKHHEQFMKEMQEKYGEEYVALGEYINCKTHMIIKHCCGHEWLVSPSNILRGYGCPVCGTKRRIELSKKSPEVFEREVLEIGHGEYDILGDYLGNRIKIKLLHKVCDNTYDVTPSNFLKGRGCPHCHSSSNGEREIRHFLKDNHIPFVKNFSFSDCQYKRVLTFDVGINSDGYTPILIEFQGSQHYSPRDFFGGEKTFQTQLKKDKIKYDYCVTHHYNLIIIPYWNFKKIKQILESELLPLLEGR